MGARDYDRRGELRRDVLEFGMLWRPVGMVPERVGQVVVTNVSLGGLQLQMRNQPSDAERLLLQLGSDNGPIFIPGTIRYAKTRHAKQKLHTAGFSFAARTKREKSALAKYIVGLKERVCGGQ